MTGLNPTRNTDWERPANPWVCPDGRRVAAASVTRELWLELRRNLIGASDVGQLLGVSRYGSQLSVWADKTGRTPPSATNEAQARGLIFEDAVIRLWAEWHAEFPIEFQRAGLMKSRAHPHAGATVDRLSICPEGRCITEVKTQADVSDWTGEDGSDEIPVGIQFQELWQLGVTGRHHVHSVVLGPRFSTLHRVMYRDEALIEHLFTDVDAWWDRYITADVMPPAGAADLDVAKRLALPTVGVKRIIDNDLAEHVLAAVTARADVAAAESVRDAAMANILAAMGEATTLEWPDGTTALTWNPGKKISGADAAWRKAHSDLAAAYSEPGPDVINTSKLVENHPELIESGSLRYQRTVSWK